MSQHRLWVGAPECLDLPLTMLISEGRREKGSGRVGNVSSGSGWMEGVLERTRR